MRRLLGVFAASALLPIGVQLAAARRRHPSQGPNKSGSGFL